MNIWSIIIALILTVAFVLTGSMKLLNVGNPRKRWTSLGLPGWLKYVTGICEVLCAIGMLVSLLLPLSGVLAGLVLVVLLIGAIGTHLRVHDSFSWYVPAGLLLLLVCVYLIMLWPVASTLIAIGSHLATNRVF